MKKLIALFFCTVTVTGLFAQNSGRSFISGTLSYSLQSAISDDESYRYNATGLNLDINIGKFVSDNHVSGFRISGKLASYDQPENDVWGDRSNGISDYDLGLGKFWQYYKPLGGQWGLYGQHDIGLGFNNQRRFALSGQTNYTKTITQTYSLDLSLSGGLYYTLSERWWFSASIGFGKPVSLEFKKASSVAYDSQHSKLLENNETDFTYKLIPHFNLPSVGFGVIYFLK